MKPMKIMETLIMFFDYDGKLFKHKESSYMQYREGDMINFENQTYEVMVVLYDESLGVKAVSAYRVLPKEVEVV